MLPYVVGIVLSIAVASFARWVGFDRDRAFYPAVLIVVASYYVLFAAMIGSVETVLFESILMTAFVIAAVAGFKGSPWLVDSPLMAFRTPSTATSSQTPAFLPGGRRGVWRMTSAPLVLSPGF